MRFEVTIQETQAQLWTTLAAAAVAAALGENREIIETHCAFLDII